MANSLNVAVIGAGAAGRTAARELQRESHLVVVYERSHGLGGTWVYDPRVESDLLGRDPNRYIVHGSLYKSLETNLPRELMSFGDFKFGEKTYGDPWMFPGHKEVLKFLEDFASSFELRKLIRFNTEVIRVELGESGMTKFVVESKSGGLNLVEVFDAVVVSNGHNTKNLPTDIPDIETWSKKQMHSHNYRVSEPFRDQVVVLIGSGPTAMDLSREIGMVAKEVHMSSRFPDVKVSKLDKFINIWQHAKITWVNKDGKIAFEDGSSIEADIIFHCIGYKYHVPFLKTNGIVSTHEKRIGPLYKHVFSPQLAPRLSFVGIADTSIIFPVVEGQSRWISMVLSKRLSLPSEYEMIRDVEQHYREMKEKWISERRTHSLNFKINYLEWIYAQFEGVVEKRIKDMLGYIFQCYMTHLYGYKDAFMQKYGS